MERQRCLDPDPVNIRPDPQPLPSLGIPCSLAVALSLSLSLFLSRAHDYTVCPESWIRIRIRFVLKGWIRIQIRSISDRIRNPTYMYVLGVCPSSQRGVQDCSPGIIWEWHRNDMTKKNVLKKTCRCELCCLWNGSNVLVLLLLYRTSLHFPSLLPWGGNL